MTNNDPFARLPEVPSFTLTSTSTSTSHPHRAETHAG